MFSITMVLHRWNTLAAFRHPLRNSCREAQEEWLSGGTHLAQSKVELAGIHWRHLYTLLLLEAWVVTNHIYEEEKAVPNAHRVYIAVTKKSNGAHQRAVVVLWWAAHKAVVANASLQ